MTRVVACGDVFASAVEVLGLEVAADRPDLVLVDLDDDGALERAADIAPEIPRIVVVGPERDLIVRAIGSRVPVARSADPAVVGPVIASLGPERRRSATRVYVVTGVAGGSGRTILVANLAARLAARVSVVALDATGTGALAWWLGLAPSTWSDLEGLVGELTREHLAVIAAERDRLRLIGGAGAMPSVALLSAATRASEGLADVALIDAPSLLDERTRVLVEVADRIVVLAADAAVGSAALDTVAADDRTWLIASRTHAQRIGDHAVLRALPDDAAAVRAAARGPSLAAGALGRAYDELADLIALDLA